MPLLGPMEPDVVTAPTAGPAFSSAPPPTTVAGGGLRPLGAATPAVATAVVGTPSATEPLRGVANTGGDGTGLSEGEPGCDDACSCSRAARCTSAECVASITTCVPQRPPHPRQRTVDVLPAAVSDPWSIYGKTAGGSFRLRAAHRARPPRTDLVLDLAQRAPQSLRRLTRPLRRRVRVCLGCRRSCCLLERHLGLDVHPRPGIWRARRFASALPGIDRPRESQAWRARGGGDDTPRKRFSAYPAQGRPNRHRGARGCGDQTHRPAMPTCRAASERALGLCRGRRSPVQPIAPQNRGRRWAP